MRPAGEGLLEGRGCGWGPIGVGRQSGAGPAEGRGCRNLVGQPHLPDQAGLLATVDDEVLMVFWLLFFYIEKILCYKVFKTSHLFILYIIF